METQTCNQCRIEKSINEFHRRGDGHKRICKSCVSAYYKTRRASVGKTRTTKAIVEKRIHFPENWDKIQGLLEVKAQRYASETGDNMLADDILSVMKEAVLLKAEEGHNMAYLLRCADWKAAMFIQKSRTYNFHVDTIEEPDTIAVAQTVEDVVVQNEISDELRAIIAQLSPRRQRIVAMLSLGYSQVKIARELNVRPATIHDHLLEIRKNMLTLGAAPA